jgi:hypothetical protein
MENPRLTFVEFLLKRGDRPALWQLQWAANIDAGKHVVMNPGRAGGKTWLLTRYEEWLATQPARVVINE